MAREEGTTRDNVIAWIDNRFILIDTAGLKDPNDDFEASIQDQIQDAIESADIILVTLDSTKYFDHRDVKIAKDAPAGTVITVTCTALGAAQPVSATMDITVE